MRLFSHHIVIHVLLALLIRGSQSSDADLYTGPGPDTYGIFDIVINENERITKDINLLEPIPDMLPSGARRIQSAYIDPRIGGQPRTESWFTGNVACFFYQPYAEERDRLVSPLFRFDRLTYRSDPIRFSPEESFEAKYVSCFYSSSSAISRRDEALVLLDRGPRMFDDEDPHLIRLKKYRKRFSGWRIWDERGKRKFAGRPISGPPNAVQRFFNDNLLTEFGESAIPRPVSKAILVWPERDSITCFVVKSDEQSPPQPLTLQSPMTTPTEDVVGIYCEEFEG